MLAPTTAPPDAWRKGDRGGKSAGRQGTLELLGRRLANSAPAGHSDSDLGPALEPWGTRTPRRSNRTHLPAASPPQLDAGALRQCLLVRQSRHATPLSEDDPIKLKHFTQFVRKEGKVNYNNPYRNHKAKERRALGESRKYAFDSVNAYIHFNRIYPQVTGQQNSVPPLSGFPVHCTDTVLLRMMFDMNRPPLRKSSAKYSDVAKSRDLDEYLVVRPPSGPVERPRRGRSPTKAYSHSLAKSGASQSETVIPEEEAAPAWAGNDVTESPGVDGTDDGKE